MTDNANAGGNAAGGEDLLRNQPGGDGGGVAGDAGGNAGAGAGDDKSLAGLAAGADDKGGAPASWPENWRELLAGDNQAALRELKRYGSVGGLWQKIENQNKLISQGAHKIAPALAEDASPEEVAAYRKAAGIPEAPDGYGIRFAPEFKASDGDNAALQAWLGHAHSKHMTPAAAKAGVEWYQAQAIAAREAEAAAAHEARIEAQVELRKEFGPELKRNLQLADEFLDKYPGLAAIVDVNRPNPAVLKDIIGLAREFADEEALYGGDGAGGGKSIDDEIAALKDKSFAGKLSQAEDARYNDLIAARMRRDQRRTSRAA